MILLIAFDLTVTKVAKVEVFTGEGVVAKVAAFTGVFIIAFDLTAAKVGVLRRGGAVAKVVEVAVFRGVVRS